MQAFDYLIIGGGVASVTAAEEIRSRDAGASVAIVSGEAEPLYSRVLLPHYVKGRIRREQVFLRKAEDYDARGIRRIAGERAVAIDTARREVFLASGDAIGFRKVIIASGGTPRPLGIPGEGLKGVSRFQTIADADQMLGWLKDAKAAVVLGAGFIALEYLDILAERKIPTTLLFRGPHFFSGRIDAAGGEFLAANFRRHGITIMPNRGVSRLEGKERITAVVTITGERIRADFLGAGIGVSKDQEWLRRDGIAVGESGVRVNEYLEAAVPGVFATGDAAEIADTATGRARSHGNWGHAVFSGKIAAENALGKSALVRCDAVSSYSIRSIGLGVVFLGDTRLGGAAHTVSRLDPNEAWYECFIIEQGRVVGVALINRGSDRASALRLIREGVRLANPGILSNPALDLGAVS